MQIKLTDITPEMAVQMLKDNTRNRNMNVKLVADYARDMAAGAWDANGESIKIDVTGVILDGQHRLSAIVESGVTLKNVVLVTGLAPDMQRTIDTGRKRTMGDVLAISGESNAFQLAAIARRVWMWDQGNLKFTNSSNPSTSELSAVVEKYPTLRRSAEISVITANSFRPCRQATVGTTHHLFLSIDPDLTAEFFARLGNGAGLDEGHPILTLRNRLMRDKMESKNVPFHLSVALYIRAWNAVREGRTMAKIQHTADEPMILPV